MKTSSSSKNSGWLRAALLDPGQDELVFYRCEACGCLMQTAGKHSVCEAPPASWTRMIGRTALLVPTPQDSALADKIRDLSRYEAEELEGEKGYFVSWEELKELLP